jgi:hypothetical protein
MLWHQKCCFVNDDDDDDLSIHFKAYYQKIDMFNIKRCIGIFVKIYYFVQELLALNKEIAPKNMKSLVICTVALEIQLHFCLLVH